jgi:hypothetical protein
LKTSSGRCRSRLFCAFDIAFGVQTSTLRLDDVIFLNAFELMSEQEVQAASAP